MMLTFPRLRRRTGLRTRRIRRRIGLLLSVTGVDPRRAGRRGRYLLLPSPSEPAGVGGRQEFQPVER